jgi:hypothetical protein
VRKVCRLTASIGKPQRKALVRTDLLVGEKSIGRMGRILLDMALDAGYSYRRFISKPFRLRRYSVCCARLHVRSARDRSASWEGQPLPLQAQIHSDPLWHYL